MQKQDQKILNKFAEMLSTKRLATSENNFYDELGQTAFENDYTRMIMSAPVRRLQDKAQVFPLDRTDFTRTRLTHSLEVADIAKQLGVYVERLLCKKYGKSIQEKDYIAKHYIPQILQVSGLIHDIGNPPCGHFGEQTIKEYFVGLKNAQKRVEKVKICKNQIAKGVISNGQELKSSEIEAALLIAEEASLSVERTYTYTNRIAEAYNKLTPQQKADLEHFDGNVQDLRLLTHLGLANDKHSFNLTSAVLATIIKYPYSSTRGNKTGEGISHMQSKFGYFETEEQEYKNIIKNACIGEEQRYPLTYLLEAADDITYLTCDVEDGYRLGIITIDDIIRALRNNLQGKSSHIYDKRNLKNKIKNIELFLINKEEYDQAREEEYVQELRILAQQIMIKACATLFVSKFKEIVEGSYTEELLGSSEAKSIQNAFKSLSRKNFDNYGVIKSELLGGKAIATLMDVFVRALYDDSITKEEDGKRKINFKTEAYKIYSLISPNYKKVALSNVEEVDFLYDPLNNYAYQKFQLVSDFIAGMTDNYALQLYRDLTIGY